MKRTLTPELSDDDGHRRLIYRNLDEHVLLRLEHTGTITWRQRMAGEHFAKDHAHLQRGQGIVGAETSANQRTYQPPPHADIVAAIRNTERIREQITPELYQIIFELIINNRSIRDLATHFKKSRNWARKRVILGLDKLSLFYGT